MCLCLRCLRLDMSTGKIEASDRMGKSLEPTNLDLARTGRCTLCTSCASCTTAVPRLRLESRVSLSDTSNNPAGQSTVQTKQTEAGQRRGKSSTGRASRAGDCRLVFVCSVPLCEPCVVSPESDRSSVDVQIAFIGSSHAPPTWKIA